MQGVLLINLGTPAQPTAKMVKPYLRQFLMDPYVINLSFFFRWILVNLIIVPFRSKKSAEAYQKIWTKQGSPLYVNSYNLTKKLRKELGAKYWVKLAMRYGQPSIESRLEFFNKKKIKDLIVFPLYPQYAESSTQSSIDEVRRVITEKGYDFNLSIIPPFYSYRGYIMAFEKIGREYLNQKKYDHILFSYHGLPEDHITKLDESESYCLKSKNCCYQISRWNKNCYRAQCYQTTFEIAQRLNLADEDFSVSFQSRLGRKPWIKPYTDQVLENLALRGKSKVLVFCPAFVADCLETLEEIQLREKEEFIKNGGEELDLVSSLNDHPAWVDAVSKLIIKYGKKV